MRNTLDRDILITELNKNVSSQQELIEYLADLVVHWSNISTNAWVEVERLRRELLKRIEEHHQSLIRAQLLDSEVVGELLDSRDKEIERLVQENEQLRNVGFTY